MDLLGPYVSNLSNFHYQELLALLQLAIANGEYAGGSLFDSTTAQALEQQGVDFSSLPVISADSRAYADQINTPVQQLQARYSALSSESADFQTRLSQLLTVLDKDASLIEQILAVALGNDWASQQQVVSGALPFNWDFAAGYGSSTTDIPPINPATGVEYSTICPIDTASSGGDILIGLTPPYVSTKLAVKNPTWTYTLPGQIEVLSGDDWAQLTCLAPNPILQYNTASATLILPVQSTQAVSDLFIISGTGIEGNLPVFVQIVFILRASTITFNAVVEGVSLVLSPYKVSADGLVVYDNTQTYQLGVDYTLDVNNNFIPGATLVGKTVSVLFQEYYPAYQCSINQNDWSNPIMLDPDRMYPDGTTTFVPIAYKVVGGSTYFPLTDELGNFLGFYMQRVVSGSSFAVPVAEMQFSVVSSVSEAVGAQVQLSAELEEPGYMNGFYLEPFTSYPMTLTALYLEGFNGASTQVLTDPILLTHGVKATFTTQAVRSIQMNLTQESYTLEQVTVEPPDYLERNTLAALQSVLPFSVQRIQSSVPAVYEGAEYDFGVQSMYGEYRNYAPPGVFVAGPFEIPGMPEVVRLDVSSEGTIVPYLEYQAFNSNQVMVDSGEVGMTAGTAVAYPSSVQAATVKMYLKFVLTGADSMVNRYLLQVTLV